MNAANKYPKTLIEAVRYFSELDIAHSFFVNVRWSDGVVRCPHCGAEGAKFLAKYRRWECVNKHPKCQFTVKVGSIMEDSPLGLDKWAVAMWLEANAKNSISSYEIHRALGITQKSAWFMLHRLRHALHVGSFDKKLTGIVEADETAVGGKASNMHRSVRARRIGKGTGSAGKTVVMGILCRGGEVRTEILREQTTKAIRSNVQKHVEPGSHLMTDELYAYKTLADEYVHQFVNHASEYVRNNVHTNGLENFWSLFKRCIKGTHVSIEPFHLQAYLDSECFRFNCRTLTDGERFLLAVQGFAGKRLTYASLTGGTEFLPANRDNDEGRENQLN